MSGVLTLMPYATRQAASATATTCGGDGQPPLVTRAPGYVAPTPPPTRSISDILASAQTIQCGASVTGDTANGVAIISHTNVAKEVLFRFTVSTSAEVTLSTCGSSFDTYLQLYTTAGIIAGASPLAYNDDSNVCTNGFHSIITHEVAAGTEYVIVVEGFNSNEGVFQLTLSCNGPQPTQRPPSTAPPANSPPSTPPPITSPLKKPTLDFT